MAIRSRPTLKCGPSAATTTARTVRVGGDRVHGPGQVGPERRAHGVALLGAVEPQGGDMAVGLDGEDLGGEGVDAGAGVVAWDERRRRAPPAGVRPVPERPEGRRAGPRSGQVESRPRPRDPGLLPREAAALTTFTPESAAALPGPAGCSTAGRPRPRRSRLVALPTEKDEVWRYSRIDQLDLDRFRPAAAGGAGSTGRGCPRSEVHALIDSLGPRVGPDGDRRRGPGHGGLARSTTISSPWAACPSARTGDALLGSVMADPARLPTPQRRLRRRSVVVDVAPGAGVEDPIVVVHLVSGRDGDAVFPRTVDPVRSRFEGRRGRDPRRGGHRPAGRPARPTAAPGAGRTAGRSTWWCRSPRSGGREAALSLRQRAVTGPRHLGARPPGEQHRRQAPRSRASPWPSEAATPGCGPTPTLAGASGTSLLRAAFIGRDEQMLDFRTLQDHVAPRTTSDLLFMGAVADHAHSVYSGLIRVRRGAVRADAMQTNHNLVLDEGAHADSVPNLDIEENDVRCSHASTVGPVDEEQRYYLESRGVEPEVAERLIVAGFFEDIAGPGPRRRSPADGGPGPGRPDRGGRWLSRRSTVRAVDDGPPVRPGRPGRRGGPALRRRPGCGSPWCGSATTSTPSATGAATRTTRWPRGRCGPRSARSSAPSTARPSTCGPASPARSRPPGRCPVYRVVVDGDDVSVVVP